MATNLILPSLGFDMTEGKVAGWRKAEGERVAKGEPILEVETEKANVEVESPASGILARIVVAAGSTVPVGTVVGIVADEGEAVPPPTAGRPSGEPPGTVPGSGPPPPRAEGAAMATPPSEGEGAGSPGERVKASPLAKRIAREAGVDLSRVRGTGTDGRITEKDVEGAVARLRGGAPPSPAGGAPLPPSGGGEAPPSPPQEGGRVATLPPPREGSTLVPLSRMRRTIARRMAASKASTPHFYITVELRMDEAMRLRASSKGSPAGATGISLLDIVVSAAARALPRFPLLNASFRDDAIETHSRVSVGIAVAVDGGLVTPVLHDADRKSLPEVARESRELISRARAGRLRPDDLGPGTFTVSSLSSYGVDSFAGIINPPEAAVLAVGAASRRPVADGDEVRVAWVMKATLSVDHRVADGVVGSRFLQEFRRLAEAPGELMEGAPPTG